MNCNYKVKITDIQTKYKFKVFCTGYDDSELKQKIDTMYEAWPKASGEGETPTLDNTANATMSIDLKGNTSQDGTPTPDDPVDVHVVTGDNEIVVCGKNLLENQYLPIPNADATATYTCKNAYLPQGTYTLATTNNSNFGNTVYIKLFKENKEAIKESGHLTTSNVSSSFSTGTYNYFSTGTSSTTYLTFTIDNNYYVRIGLLNSDNTKEVMLVKGSEAVRTYQPYQSQSYAVNLGTMELCKIGDYQDYIYKDNKKWYKYGAIGKVVLNGSETWGQGNPNFRYITTITSQFKEVTTPLSNYFKGGAYSYGVILQNIDSTSMRINLYYDSITSDYQALKTWLSTHNTDVYYVYATPTTTEITDATLISQLNALAGAESYSGQTNISQTNDDKPFILTAKALKDLSNL